jgi:hypothetical protein
MMEKAVGGPEVVVRVPERQRKGVRQNVALFVVIVVVDCLARGYDFYGE